MRTFALVAVATVVVACAGGAAGSVTFVGTRAELGADDRIDWRQFGASFGNVASGAAGTSNGGAGFTVGTPRGVGLQRRDAGNGWTGGFAPGDRILWTVEESSSVVVITFSRPVVGAGMQVWRNLRPGGTVRIDAFDGAGVLLGTGAASTGGGSAANSNQASFLGLVSTERDIRRLEFTMTNGGALAFNQLDVVTVPGPGGLAVAGAMSVAVMRRRRRRTV